MAADARCLPIATVSPNSGLGRPSSQALQPSLISSRQVVSPQVIASQHVSSSQVPNYQPSPSSSSATIAPPPNGATNAMFRVQMWSNNFDSGVHSMNHSSVGFLT